MVTNKPAATLKLIWTVLLTFSVSTAVTIENQKAKSGEEVYLTCNEKKPLNWLYNDNESIGRQKGRIQQNVYGNLIIKSVRYSDSGVYTCTSVDGSIAHKRIRLEVSGPPKLVNVTSDVEVEYDKEAVLNCEALGHPLPVITWFMYKSGQKQKIADGSTLQAKMPCKFCHVYFMCQAVNRFGKISMNITVQVVGKPEVNILEKSITGVIGQNVTVHCAIKSNPPLKYMKWLKNGKLVQATNRKRLDFHILSTYEMHVSLSIEKLKEKDFDYYECLAVNDRGNETQKVQIRVKSRKPFRKSKGKLRISPLSASTELVISSGEIQKQNAQSKKQDKNVSKQKAATESADLASSSSGSICKKSWKEFTVIILLQLFTSLSFLLS